MNQSVDNNAESWKIIWIINDYYTRLEKTKWKLFVWLNYDTPGNGLVFNKAYFSQWDNIEEVIKDKVAEADKKIAELNELKDEVQKEELLNEAQKRLVISKIQKEIDLFEYHKNAIYLEWEKAGQGLTQEEREDYNQKKLEIEQKLYWDPITEIKFRKNKALEKLDKLYKKSGKTVLAPEEQEFWEKKMQPIINEANTTISENENNNWELQMRNAYIKEENIFRLVELALQIQWIEPDNTIRIQYSSNEEQSEVIRENDMYIVPKSWKSEDIYKYFDSIWEWQKFKIIKKITWTNAVNIEKQWDKFKRNDISLWAPENWRYNLNKVLPIIFDHEIATHVNTWIWNFNNLNLNDPDRWYIEESIANLNQNFAKNSPLSEYYESGKWDICQLLWEVFDDKDLKKAIEIYFKLTNDTEDIDWRFLRIRKWVPKWYKWARRQDMVYWEWKNIVKELEELTKTPEWVQLLNKYIKAFYSTKLWYNSIKNIDEILQWIWELEDLEPNFPIFAWKIIYWKLLNGKVNTDEMLANDIRSVIETNKNITYEQKKLLVQILKLIREDEVYKKSIDKDKKSTSKE